MKNLLQYKGAMATAIFIASSAITNSASAFGSLGRDVDQFCANAGNPLLAEFQPQVEDNCTACHDNGSKGGGGAGKTAHKRNNFEVFCPPPLPPQTCTDADMDGFNAEGSMCGAIDLNDNNPDVYPGAPEICTDGVDNDGNGLIDQADPAAINCAAQCTDMDGDTYSTEGGLCGPVDCNDNDALINPGAEESCSDGIDNNCNGKVDSADPNAVGCPIMCTDIDGDGYSIEGGACGAMDCDDTNSALNPGAMEICGDGIDNNCDARIDSADRTCQAMDNDDVLKEKHRKARLKFEACKAEFKESKQMLRQSRKNDDRSDRKRRWKKEHREDRDDDHSDRKRSWKKSDRRDKES